MEAPALGRIHQEFHDRGVNVLAINTAPWSTLEEWRDFWKRKGAGEVIWSTNSDQQVARLLRLTTLGNNIVIDQRGDISYRDGGTPYDILLAQVGKVL